MAIDTDVRVVPGTGPPIAPDDPSTTAEPAVPPAGDGPAPALGTRRSRRRPAGLPVLAVAGGLAVLSMYVTHGQAQWLTVIGGLLSLGALTRAVASERRRDRLFSGTVAYLTLGVLLVVASEVMHAFGAAYASYADGFALMSYPALLAGLIGLTQARFRESALDTLLVAAIVPASLGVFAWLPLVEAIQRWVPHGSSHSWTAAVFLAVDVLAITIIARLAIFFRGQPIAYQLLLGALTCMLGAHISRAVANLSDVVPAPLGSQALMLVGFGLVAVAVLHPSMRRATRLGRARPVQVGRGHLGLLSAAILLGPAIVIWRYLHLGSWVIVAAAGPALVSLLVVVHLSRMIRERQRLEFATNHDPLTGLVNRSCFHDRVMHTLARADSFGAVMFLDLDRFKTVNDTLGHDAGDQLLRLVAQRLETCVRRGDTVARISGDEFAVLLPSTNGAQHASHIAERMLAQFDRPFPVAGHSLSMTPSIGIAMHPEHGEDVDTLLRHADAAMYQAKAAGRKTIRVYDGSHDVSAARKLAVESRLRRAVADDELLLHYQPRFDVRTGEVLGMEALLRWAHPTEGLVPVESFGRLVGDTDLVDELGTWMLHSACAQMAAWHAAGHEGLTVSLDVFAHQFDLRDVPALVRETLAATGLAADALELELPESAGLQPDGPIGLAVAQLREMGVRCSVDEFGSSYSSVGDLHDFPVDTVKLHPDFVRHISVDPDSPVVRAIVSMAHNLDIRVVALGVDSTSQMTFLKKSRCDEVQGFLYCQPLHAEDVPAFLDRHATLSPTARRRVPRAAHVPMTGLLVDEQCLLNLVWEEAAQSAPAGDPRPLVVDDEEDEEGSRRGALALLVATAAMVMPVVLGLGAGGALPPVVQERVTDAFRTVGAEAPQSVTEPRPVPAASARRAKAPTAEKRRERVAVDRERSGRRPAAGVGVLPEVVHPPERVADNTRPVRQKRPPAAEKDTSRRGTRRAPVAGPSAARPAQETGPTAAQQGPQGTTAAAPAPQASPAPASALAPTSPGPGGRPASAPGPAPKKPGPRQVNKKADPTPPARPADSPTAAAPDAGTAAPGNGGNAAGDTGNGGGNGNPGNAAKADAVDVANGNGQAKKGP